MIIEFYLLLSWYKTRNGFIVFQKFVLMKKNLMDICWIDVVVNYPNVLHKDNYGSNIKDNKSNNKNANRSNKKKDNNNKYNDNNIIGYIKQRGNMVK